MSRRARRRHGRWAHSLWGGVKTFRVSSLSSAAEQRQVVCHALRVVELREQLEVEEEDGDRQEEEEEVESGEVESRRVRHVDDHGWRYESAQDLSHGM